MEETNFPRNITPLEKELLFSVLPENKPGYNLYRYKISHLVVTGHGRFDRENLILGKSNIIPDSSLPSTPVFALGTVVYKDNKADVIIHEEIDDEIEFDITFDFDITENLAEIKRWSYSEWNPGDKAPGDNSEIREIKVLNGKYILAIAPAHKKIWLHIFNTGVNMLVPVTNFYNYLMIVKNIRSAEKVFKPAFLFSELNNFTDAELKKAFLAYNKYFNRIKLEQSPAAESKTGSGAEKDSHKPGNVQSKVKALFKFLKRG